MPLVPHGKGWMLINDDSVGVAAGWTKMGMPVGIAHSISVEGEHVTTPFDANG